MKFPKERKMRFLKLVCMLLSAAVLLAGCGQSEPEPTYEGVHLALVYDAEKWTASYQEAEPYPVFDLALDEDEIIIMIVENDGSVFDNLHGDFLDMCRTEGTVTEKGKTDEWSQNSWMYYEDLIEMEQFGTETLITYAKGQDNILLVGIAEVMVSESGEENTERIAEVLEIFASMRYSEQGEPGELQQDAERENITYIYDILNLILEYGADSSDEPVSNEEDAGETETAADTDTETEEQAPEVMQPLSEEELAALQYVEKIVLEDYYGDKAEYEAFAPKETEITYGRAFYWEHGLEFYAGVYCEGVTSFLYEYMDYSIEYDLEDWQEEDSGYTDVETTGPKKNGDDRYQIITAKKEDYYGTPYVVKKIAYLHIPEEGVGILWELEVSENGIDEETEKIIDELARCYCVNLDEMKAGGSWSEDNAERLVQEQDEYVPEEGDNVVEKVDGYQYMGLTTLTVEEREVECPVMVPIGRRTHAKGNRANCSMHGVSVSGNIDFLMQHNFSATVKFYSDIRYDSVLEDTERNRNVDKSGIMYIPGFEEAAYVIIPYEEKDYVTQEFAPKIEVLCYIRIDNDFYLDYSITLNYDEYDAATNTVIKELETAYGIDLSEYYNENE